MKAQNDFCARGTFDAQALCADWDASIGAGFDQGANTPNIRPPGAVGGLAQDRAVFFFGQIPRPLWDHAQFAMGFMVVAMEAQSIDVGVGHFNIGYFFAGEIGWEAALPELVFALDFSFCLRCWSIKETDVVELERPAQLSERVRIFDEEDGVVIDIDLQWASVGQESGGKEIQVGEQEFSAVNFGGDKKAAAIVEHVEHREVRGTQGKPVMGRGVQLPEFADLGTLPAAHGGWRAYGRGSMRMVVVNGPLANLGTVQLEGVKS